MMESNKEESARCKELGLKAFLTGEKEKGMRLIEKAHRMYPSSETENFLSDFTKGKSMTRAEEKNGAQGTDPNHSAFESRTYSRKASGTPNKGEAGVPDSGLDSCDPTLDEKGSATKGASKEPSSKVDEHHRSNHTKTPKETLKRDKAATSNNTDKSNRTNESKQAEDVGTSERSYTPEQEVACKKILRTKCYYEALGVPKNANDDTIKKSYRKLALQLHPDKNKAPSAEEAFKKISKMFQCLSDANKRAMYNQFGNDDDVPQQYRNQYESDLLTPEDLFEHFFGMDFSANGRRVFRRVRRQPATPQQQRTFTLVQMLPVIIILGFSLLSSLRDSTPKRNFSPTQSYEFTIPRKTHSLSIDYFVGKHFDDSFRPGSKDLKLLETEVELRHYHELCSKEELAKMQLNHHARHYRYAGSDEYKKKMEELNKGACTTFHRLQEVKVA